MARYGVYGTSFDDESDLEEDTQSISSEEEEEEDESDSDASTRATTPTPEPSPEPAWATGKAPTQGQSTSTNSEKIARSARARLTLIKITSKKHNRKLDRLLSRNRDRTPIPHPNPLPPNIHHFPATIVGLHFLQQNQHRRRPYHPRIKEREVCMKKFKLCPVREVKEIYKIRKELRERVRDKKRKRMGYWDEDDDDEEEGVERDLRCKRIKFADGAFGYLDTTKTRHPTPDSRSSSGSSSSSSSASANENEDQTSDQRPRKKKKNKNRSKSIWSCPIMRSLEFISNCIPTVEDLGGGVATSTSIPGRFPGVSD